MNYIIIPYAAACPQHAPENKARPGLLAANGVSPGIRRPSLRGMADVRSAGHESARPAFAQADFAQTHAEAEHAQGHGKEAKLQQRRFLEQGETLLEQGKLQLHRKEWQSAIKFFSRARAAALKLNDVTAMLRIEHRAVSGMSTAHRCLRDFDTAIALGTKAVEVARKLGDDACEAQKLLDIAFVGEAARLLNDGMMALNPVRRVSTTSSGGTDRQTVHFDREDTNSVGAATAALPKFEQALTVSYRMEDMMMREKVERSSLLNIGCAKLTMSLLDEAVQDFKRCLALARKWKDVEIEETVKENLCKALRAVQVRNSSGGGTGGGAGGGADICSKESSCGAAEDGADGDREGGDIERLK